MKAMNKMTSLVERKVYALTNNLPVPKDVEHDLFTFYERFEKLQQEIAILDERMLNRSCRSHSRSNRGFKFRSLPQTGDLSIQ